MTKKPASETTKSKKPAAHAKDPAASATPSAVAPVVNAPGGEQAVEAPKPADKPEKTSGALAIVHRIVSGEGPESVASYATALEDEREGPATQAARVLEELASHKPDLLVPHVDRIVRSIHSKNGRVVQCAGAALPVLARIAPARVARHLDVLTGRFGEASLVGKDGLVRTFAALCIASVAYQKRLEAVIEEALAGADAKHLQRWTDIVLPALKGEPHATARAVVEKRVHGDIPRPIAQKIAATYGIKLRRQS